MNSKRQSYEFTLVLAEVTELTDQLTDALYEAGCDDALVGCQNGTVFLDFNREAETVEMAVQSAIANVEAAGFLPQKAHLEIVKSVHTAK